jgi:hypothetical protein
LSSESCLPLYYNIKINTWKIKALAVVLYGCETGSLTRKKEETDGALDLRGGGGVVRGGRKLHNEKLHVACTRETRNKL